MIVNTRSFIELLLDQSNQAQYIEQRLQKLSPWTEDVCRLSTEDGSGGKPDNTTTPELIQKLDRTRLPLILFILEWWKNNVLM